MTTVTPFRAKDRTNAERQRRYRAKRRAATVTPTVTVPERNGVTVDTGEVVGLVSELGDIVDAVKKHRPDGIFLDVNLRGRKVFDVLPELITLGVPCVLTSGYGDPTLFPLAFRNLPRIAKPFDESAVHRVCVEFGLRAKVRQGDRSPAQ